MKNIVIYCLGSQDGFIDWELDLCYKYNVFWGTIHFIDIWNENVYIYKEDRFLVLSVYFILLGFCGFINFKFSKHLEKLIKLVYYGLFILF